MTDVVIRIVGRSGERRRIELYESIAAINEGGIVMAKNLVNVMELMKSGVFRHQLGLPTHCACLNGLPIPGRSANSCGGTRRTSVA